MASINQKANIARPSPKTHEGATASRINTTQELRRSVMACMLWENEFYEDGVSIANRISALIPTVPAEKVAEMAIEAREKMKLRHVPLLIVKEMAAVPTHKHLVASTLERIIQRADELTEFLAMYQIGRTGKKKLNKLSKQVQKGLAKAFTKFDEYQLAKYNRDTEIKLRDVLFLSHAKPKDEAQAALWKRLIAGELKTPDTWEVEISASKDKKASWERLLVENKLGALALLRNLRNMQDAKVTERLVFSAMESMDTRRVLPFRFIASAKYAPQWESQLEAAMFKCLAEVPKLHGKTALLVDHSGSMEGKLSEKSEMTRFDAAAAIGMILREICDDVAVFTFSDNCIRVPSRRGFAMREAIMSRINPVGTLLGKAVNFVYEKYPECERLIVITDEQSHDTPGNQHGKGYVINVGSAKNGIGYGAWKHIDGFSEHVIDYIKEVETTDGV